MILIASRIKFVAFCLSFVSIVWSIKKSVFDSSIFVCCFQTIWWEKMNEKRNMNQQSNHANQFSLKCFIKFVASSTSTTANGCKRPAEKNVSTKSNLIDFFCFSFFRCVGVDRYKWLSNELTRIKRKKTKWLIRKKLLVISIAVLFILLLL